MSDIYYRDTDERYRNDAAFHAAVKMLEQLARTHGLTPGELKQIAFKAALNIEMKRPIGYVEAQRCAACDEPLFGKLQTYQDTRGRMFCNRTCFGYAEGR